MHYLFLLPGLIIGLTVHEAAHAISARWLGDHLAWRQGRVSLNPLRHLSLLGTLALFVLGFGWGKPVPVNLYNFRHPKRDYLLCSLAGPFSNCLLCALALSLMTLSPSGWFLWILVSVFMTNGVLAVANLIPIPPLDGSKIWPCLIPGLRPAGGAEMTKVWMVVLLVGIYSGATGQIIRPALDFLSDVMLTVLDDTQTYEERPEGFPEGLTAPADACEVTYHVYPRRGDGLPDYALDYCIDRPYPCDALITGVAADLEDRGWRRTAYLVHEPNRPATDVWDVSSHEEGWRTYVWSGTWIKDSRQWVSLVVSYGADPNEQDPPSTAWVETSLVYEGDDGGDLGRYRRLHPEEFAGP